MKIGIDARFFSKIRGGIATYSQELIRELANIDNKNQYTIILNPEAKKEFENLVKAKNFKPLYTNIIHYSVSEQTKFLRLLNRQNFDLIHFLNFNHPILYKKPFITTIHDLTMLLYPAGKQQKSWIKRFAFKKVMSSAVKGAQKVIAVSRATKNDCVKILGANPDKIKIIYEAVNKKYSFLKANEAKKLTKLKSYYKITKPYLLFVSQWRPHKGLPELVRTFEILKEKYNSDIQLVITGKPNPDFPQIPYAISHSPYAKGIITPGFFPEKELPILYAGAESYIFPSFYEGFGLGPLEAMASGTPVVSSNLSCMPEVLGNAAKYFNPNNINEMASVINKVLIDKKLQEKMNKTGLIQAKKYSWRKMAEETLNVYKKVLSK